MDAFNPWEFVTVLGDLVMIMVQDPYGRIVVILLLAWGIVGWFWRPGRPSRYGHAKHYRPRRRRRTNWNCNDRETVNLWADITMWVMNWWGELGEQ